MADEIAVMHEGELHQCASPHDIYDHPADMFVAGFIGEPPMNFVRRAPRPRRTATCTSSLTASTSSCRPRRAPPSQDAVAGRGARGRAWACGPSTASSPRQGQGDLAAEVFFAEWFGTHQVVMLSRPGRRDHWLTVIAEFDRGAPPPATRSPSRSTHGASSFFDPETERNLVPRRGPRR